MMADKFVASYSLTKDLIELLRQWAKEEDRTVSATLRVILQNEARRRAQEQGKEAKG